MNMRLDEFIDHAALELIDMHADDRGAALAAACESMAEWLYEHRPDLTDKERCAACVEVAKRITARLKEIDSQPAGRQDGRTASALIDNLPLSPPGYHSPPKIRNKGSETIMASSTAIIVSKIFTSRS